MNDGSTAPRRRHDGGVLRSLLPLASALASIGAVAFACGGASGSFADAGGPPAASGGDASDSVPADAGPSVDASPFACGARADCAGGYYCCAESNGDTVTASCMPTCITNLPRVQACRTDAECESGACAAYPCGTKVVALRFCQKPDFCR